MSNDIKNWAKTVRVGDRNAKVLFLELADVANDSGFCWHNIATIAETLEMSVKTVERGFAYLVEKKYITRTEREKQQGKFRSKGTQINIPSQIHEEMQIRRETRKSTFQPSDKMTYGDCEPSDILSETSEKPSDKMTDGAKNHQSFCPKPSDNLSSGQNDALNSIKELVSETTIETEEEERNTRPPVREIPASEVFNDSSDEEMPEEYSPTAAIRIWREIYPNVQLDGQQLDDFAKWLPEVNEAIWRENVFEWRLNKWGKTNFAAMIKRYKKELKTWEKEQTEINEGGKSNAGTNGNIQPARERGAKNAVGNRNIINELRSRGKSRS